MIKFSIACLLSFSILANASTDKIEQSETHSLWSKPYSEALHDLKSNEPTALKPKREVPPIINAVYTVSRPGNPILFLKASLIHAYEARKSKSGKLILRGLSSKGIAIGPKYIENILGMNELFVELSDGGAYVAVFLKNNDSIPNDFLVLSDFKYSPIKNEIQASFGNSLANKNMEIEDGTVMFLPIKFSELKLANQAANQMSDDKIFKLIKASIPKEWLIAVASSVNNDISKDETSLLQFVVDRRVALSNFQASLQANLDSKN